LRRRGEARLAKTATGTFVPERIEPNGLSTATASPGIIALDLELARHPGREPGKKAPGSVPGRPETASSPSLATPQCPPSGRFPRRPLLLVAHISTRFSLRRAFLVGFGIYLPELRPGTVKRLTLPSHRAIGGKGSRTRTESWRDGRRHHLKGCAAVAAALLGTIVDAKPMPAGRASGIQTLHSGTGQICHRASFYREGGGYRQEGTASREKRDREPQNPRGLCPAQPSVSRKIYTISRGTFSATNGGRNGGPRRPREPTLRSYCELSLVSLLGAGLAAFSFACSSAIFCCAAIISCCLASI